MDGVSSGRRKKMENNYTKNKKYCVVWLDQSDLDKGLQMETIETMISSGYEPLSTSIAVTEYGNVCSEMLFREQ